MTFCFFKPKENNFGFSRDYMQFFLKSQYFSGHRANLFLPVDHRFIIILYRNKSEYSTCTITFVSFGSLDSSF